MTDCATPQAPPDTKTRAILFFFPSLFSSNYSLDLAGPSVHHDCFGHHSTT